MEEAFEGAGDSSDIAFPYQASAGPHGALYIAVQQTSGMVEKLDSLGRFEETIGRLGPGPGEYQRPSLLVAKGDSLVVGDTRGDLAVYSGNGRYVRTLRQHFTTSARILFLRGDTLLYPTPIATTERFGFPFHLLSPAGDTVRSFGAEDRSLEVGEVYRQYRQVARASDSSFWAAHINSYRLELWATSGALQRTLEEHREWFEPWKKNPAVITAVKPVTMLQSIFPDSDGHLLVLLRRARPDWKADVTDSHKEGDGPMLALSDEMKFIEQVVEVLDANSGALVGSVVNRGPRLIRFLEDGRLFGVKESATGKNVPVVLRFIHPTRGSGK